METIFGACWYPNFRKQNRGDALIRDRALNQANTVYLLRSFKVISISGEQTTALKWGQFNETSFTLVKSSIVKRGQKGTTMNHSVYYSLHDEFRLKIKTTLKWWLLGNLWDAVQNTNCILPELSASQMFTVLIFFGEPNWPWSESCI